MVGTDIQYYTLEEIAKHDGEQDTRVWIIIRDIVYDVTEFLEQHPGGPEIIQTVAGKDATIEFEDVRHSFLARRQMKKWKIGEVVAEERKYKDEENQRSCIII
ncbi:cytochrome b5-like [Diorhabda sublineata]|uniref:cytochrome b5-like n=1 Tax=Diorhabda sublineata TaxID=1163346 RepID=UPI0024E07B38|nr:cytochrome b5-like [Diorhabda sublineata]